MNIKIEVFAPTELFDARALERIIANELNETAMSIKADFGITAQTWKHRPKFRIRKPGKYTREVATDSEIYGYVNFGTRPHVITPKRASRLRFRNQYAPKTIPRVIKSTPGGASGDYVTAKLVHHPGTEARDFDVEIAEKWDKERATNLQRAIDAEVA